MNPKSTPIGTVKRKCKICGSETEQVRRDNQYICLICLYNPDTYFENENDRTTKYESKKPSGKRQAAVETSRLHTSEPTMIYRRRRKNMRIIMVDMLSYIALPVILILVTVMAVIGAILVFIGDCCRMASEYLYKFKER